MSVARVSGRLKGQIAIAAAFALALAILNLVSHFKLLSPGNIENIVKQTAFPAFLSWGMMFIFTTGMIDLSVGANVVMSSNVGMLFAQYFGFGYAGLIIATMLCSLFLSHIVPRLVVNLEIPSWIAGLGMALVIEAALNLGVGIVQKIFPELSGTNNLRLEDYKFLGNYACIIVALAIGAAAASILFERTSIGYNVRAVGSSPVVAKAMGINTNKTIFQGVFIGGLFVGCGCILQISYAGKMLIVSGLGSLSAIFKPLAVVLLSGSIQKYINMPLGVLVCSLFIACLFNVLTLLGVPAGTWQEVLLGSIVIICGVVSALGNKGVVK
jgi:ribose transport system permease protein